MTTKAWVGVDVGGTNVAVALVDAQGHILVENTIPTTVEKGPDFAVDRIADWIRGMVNDDAYDIAGIGIGSPGPIDAESGVIQSPSNLQTWHNYPITEKIENDFAIKTVLGNDADVAGLAEYQYALRNAHENVVYVTVSTGVGGGVITHGRLHTGSSSAASEFGHMIVQKDGPLCGCGRHGCLETFSSGTGIANRMKDRLANHPDHSLQAQAAAGEFSAKDVFAAYDNGDQLAVDVITEAEDYLAISLANVVNIINPSVLIIGGGVALAQPRYVDAVKEKIGHYAIKENVEILDVVRARFQEKAGVLGAAALSMRGTD